VTLAMEKKPMMQKSSSYETRHGTRINNGARKTETGRVAPPPPPPPRKSN